MQKEFVLRDLRDFSCLSYFLSVSTTKEISIKIIGNRETGDKTYCSLNYKYDSDSVKLHENSLLTLLEPITVQFEYPDNLNCQIQLNTDSVMSAKGKILMSYSFTMDFEGDTITAVVFDLTGWKAL